MLAKAKGHPRLNIPGREHSEGRVSEPRLVSTQKRKRILDHTGKRQQKWLIWYRTVLVKELDAAKHSGRNDVDLHSSRILAPDLKSHN